MITLTQHINMKKIVFLFLVTLWMVMPASAQLLRHNFDDEGNTFIQGIARAQFWARYTETNPGTAVNGEVVNNVFDFSVRRVRLGVYAQVEKKWLFYVLLGNNNFNQSTLRTANLRLLDALAQYTFSEKLSIGIAKTTFLGAGRYSNGFSNASMLTLDPSVYYLNTLNHFDDMGRRIGVYAKGQLGKFEYFAALQNSTIPPSSFNYSKGHPHPFTSAYLKYEFWDNEGNLLPSSGGNGTYIGNKHIMNLGLGYEYQAKARTFTNTTDTSYRDYFNLGVDFFMDTPISERNDAITAYVGFNNIYFGNDYVRFVGANSIFEGGTSLNGAGNASPAVGTGSSLFLQLGYLLPKWENSDIRLQPNASWRFASYKALNNNINIYSVGVNTYFKGQKSKLSLAYENRPVFSATDKKVSTRLGTFVLQYQIEL